MIAEHEAALQAVAALSSADREIVACRLRTDADIAAGHVGGMIGDDNAARANVYRAVAALVDAFAKPLAAQPHGAS